MEQLLQQILKSYNYLRARKLFERNLKLAVSAIQSKAVCEVLLGQGFKVILQRMIFWQIPYALALKRMQ